jgi:hypothetical protein
MVLQLPFWSTFHLSSRWFPGAVGAGYVVFQLLFTAAFVWVALWLYKKLTFKEPENRWVRFFLSGVGGKGIWSALKFYRELEELEGWNAIPHCPIYLVKNS